MAKNLQESVLCAVDYYNRLNNGLKMRPVISHSPCPQLAVKELANQGVSVIFGGGASRLVREILPYCSAEGIPLIAPSSSASELAKAGDLLFRGLHDSFGPGKLAGELARKEGLSGYITFTVGENTAYSGSFARGFSAGAGLPPLHRYQVNSSLPPELMSEILDENRPFDTAVMILPDYLSSTVVQQLRLFSPGLKIWLADWGANPSVARLGGPNMEGIRQAGYFSVDLNELDQPFVRFLTNHYDKDWDPFALETSFRAVSLLVEACKLRAKGAGDIKLCLGQVHEIEGLHGPLPVNDKGDVVAPIRVAHIEKGKWVEGPGRPQP